MLIKTVLLLASVCLAHAVAVQSDSGSAGSVVSICCRLIALMHVYVTQANFTTKPRFEIKNKRSLTEMNSQGSRVEKNTHAKKVQIQKFCSQTRLVGEIYSSDVIMHRGYSQLLLKKRPRKS